MVMMIVVVVVIVAAAALWIEWIINIIYPVILIFYTYHTHKIFYITIKLIKEIQVKV